MCHRLHMSWYTQFLINLQADCLEFTDILRTPCYYPIPATANWDCASEANTLGESAWCSVHTVWLTCIHSSRCYLMILPMISATIIIHDIVLCIYENARISYVEDVLVISLLYFLLQLWHTVYHHELEVFSQSSLCFMSLLGGGTDILPFSTQDPPATSGTDAIKHSSAILGESQLFQPFLLPHCYAVKPFGYGDDYNYEIVTGTQDYYGAFNKLLAWWTVDAFMHTGSSYIHNVHSNLLNWCI